MVAPEMSASSSAPLPDTARRVDIKVLRGVAVAAVLLFHAGVLPAGYLGVDLFFALSGFLITGIVAGGLAAGDFRVGAFYRRRAERILPPALVTLATATVVAPFLLAPTAYGTFEADLVGALTLTANVVVWLQADQAAGGGGTVPLRHFWSLAVIQQFYLLWPLLLIALGPRARTAGVLAGIVLSLALALALSRGLIDRWVPPELSVAAAFYLLPARTFELLIGAAAALLVLRGGRRTLPRPVAVLAGAGLFALFAGAPGLSGPWPGVVVALLAAVFFATDGGRLPRCGAVRGFARIGDWSYSIYLVHWPLLVYGNAAFEGDAPVWLRLFLIALALPVGALQWRLVEEPLRHGGPLAPATLALRLAGATAACGLFGIAVIGPLERSYPLHAPVDAAFAAVCDEHRRHFAADDACPPRRAAVPGTVRAVHLAVLQTREARFLPGLVTIERSGCALTGPSAGPSPNAPRPCAAMLADASGRLAATTGLAKLQASKARLLDARPVDARPDGAMRTATAVVRLVKRLRNAGKRALQLAPPRVRAADLPDCRAPPAGDGPLARRQGRCHAAPSRPLPSKGPAEARRARVLPPSGSSLARPVGAPCRRAPCPTTAADPRTTSGDLYLDGDPTGPPNASRSSTDIAVARPVPPLPPIAPYAGRRSQDPTTHSAATAHPVRQVIHRALPTS